MIVEACSAAVVLADRAEQDSGESAVSAGADHDQVGLGRHIEKDLCGMALDRVLNDLHLRARRLLRS
jgi:hypothetical protein